VNPSTEEFICSVVAGVFSRTTATNSFMSCTPASPKDIDLAVAAARNAFNTTWGKNVTGFERSRLINKLADLIERDAQELAELESLNNGKPVRIARYYTIKIILYCVRLKDMKRDFDIGDSIQCLRYYAGWADKITGQVGLSLNNPNSLYHCQPSRLLRSIITRNSRSPVMILSVSAGKCICFLLMYSGAC